MPGEAGEGRRELSLASKAFGLVLSAAVAGVIVFWAYVVAWFTIDNPTPDERRAYFETIRHRGGVPARLARSGMRSLKGDAIASVGESRCDRESYCSESSRYCLKAGVRFHCTFPLVTRDGEAGTGIVLVHINDVYDPLSHLAHDRQFLIPSEMSLDEASDRLCRTGVCP